MTKQTRYKGLSSNGGRLGGTVCWLLLGVLGPNEVTQYDFEP